MKKLLHSFSGFLIMLLVSCNVFVDDDLVVDNTKWVVPVHTGVGYDEPVTIHEGGCEMTYQLNSDVRVVEQEEQNKYIVSINCSEGNAVIELRYAANTPEELLPVPGEIYLSTATEKLPYGCNHRVAAREFRDGSYVFLLTACTLKDTYKDLRLNGPLIGSKEGTYTEEHDLGPKEEDEVSEAPQGRSQTRGDDDDDEYKIYPSPFGSDKISRTKAFNMTFLDNNGIGVYFPVNASKSFSGELYKPGKDKPSYNAYGSVSIELQYNVIWTFDFKNFSLKDDRLLVEEKCRKEMKFTATLAGGGQWHKDIIELKDVPGLSGSVRSIGYLVLVFFAQHECSLDVTLTAEATFTKECITEQYIQHDLCDPKNDYKPTSRPNEPRIIKETPFTFALAISFDCRLTYKFHLCIGFYGKIISFRIIPTFTIMHFKATAPLIDSDKFKGTYITSNDAGIYFSPLEFTIQIGVFLDLDISNLLALVRNTNKQEGQEALNRYVDEINKETSFYEKQTATYRTGTFSNKEAKKNQSEDARSDDGSDLHDLSITLGPWLPFGKYECPWLPVIKSGTFVIVPSYKESDIEKGGLSYSAEYKIKDEGILTTFRKYRPAICISDGVKRLDTIFPIEGENTQVKSERTYHFEIPTLKFDKTYSIYPTFCTFDDKNPWAIDQPQKVTPISRELFCSDFGYTDAKQNIFYDIVENLITPCIDINVAGDEQYDYWYVEYTFYKNGNDRKSQTKRFTYDTNKKTEKDGYKHYRFETPLRWFTDKEEYSDENYENWDHSITVDYKLFWKYKEQPKDDYDSRDLVTFVIYPGHYMQVHKGTINGNLLFNDRIKTTKIDYYCNYDERADIEGYPRN